ncbi:hypothetical protein [Streptomyces sp. bgisy100]|uniref:hypothetical protein n=1 Tax=Streptomyces sp. bgisy100 TaxID=3413783 RepID=UPI003D73C43B
MSSQQRLSAVTRSIPNPVSSAAALTRPSRPGMIEDPVISGLHRGRTALGLLATAWLLLSYPLREGGEAFVLGKLEELVIGCGVLLVGGIVGVGFFVLAARPPLGGRYAGRLGGPLRAVAAPLLGAFTVWLMARAVSGDIISTADIGAHDFFMGLLGGFLGTLISGIVIGLAFVAGALACVAVLVGAALFTLIALVTGLNSCFRTAEVHELLPALLSPLLVWSLFVLNLVGDADVNAPPGVLYTFLLGGPLSVTALSVWEVRRLRGRYGVTLRSALGRGPAR